MKKQQPSCQPPTAAAPKSKTQIAGLYDLQETIGEGHYAVVKLARHVFTGETVAVKVIDKNKLDAATTSQMLQEVQLMKLVQHPHVVRLYEVIDTSSKLYLILEYADGGDMYDYIMKHEGGLPEKTARDYFRQIVAAIQYCHRLHVVHRDLKPENVVFFEKLGMVKLTDFGFSNKFNPGQRLETSCGSLAYSAPEILLGDAYDAPAVDIWSLGVILYMLVCGTAPFQEANDSETLTMIMDCKYSFSTNISSQCKKLISRMLQRQPENRASLQDIIDDPWFGGGSAEDGTAIPQSEQLPLISREHLTEEEHSIILKKMVQGGVAAMEDIIKALDINEYNHVTATYFLLAERVLKAQRETFAHNRRLQVVEAVGGMEQNLVREDLRAVSSYDDFDSVSKEEESIAISPMIDGLIDQVSTSAASSAGTTTSRSAGGSTAAAIRMKRKGFAAAAATATVIEEEDEEEEEENSPSSRGDEDDVDSAATLCQRKSDIYLDAPQSAPIPIEGGGNTLNTSTNISGECSRIMSRHSSVSSIGSPLKLAPLASVAAKDKDIDMKDLAASLRASLCCAIEKRDVETPTPFPKKSQIGTGTLSRSGSLRRTDSSSGMTSPSPLLASSGSESGGPASTSNSGQKLAAAKKLSQTSSSPQLKLNQIHEEEDTSQQQPRAVSASSGSTTAAIEEEDPVDAFPKSAAGAVVTRKLEQRRRLHKSYAASCSSSDASDDDSESKRRRRDAIANSTYGKYSMRRDQNDDSSDSQQDQGGGLGFASSSGVGGSGTGGYTYRRRSSSDQPCSDNNKGQGGNSGGNTHRVNSAGACLQRHISRTRLKGGRHHSSKIRQSHSLNRISELHIVDDFSSDVDDISNNNSSCPSSVASVVNGVLPVCGVDACNAQQQRRQLIAGGCDLDKTSGRLEMLTRYLDSMSDSDSYNGNSNGGGGGTKMQRPHKLTSRSNGHHRSFNLRRNSRDDSVNSSDGELDPENNQVVISVANTSTSRSRIFPGQSSGSRLLEKRLNKIAEEAANNKFDQEEEEFEPAEVEDEDEDFSDDASTIPESDQILPPSFACNPESKVLDNARTMVEDKNERNKNDRLPPLGLSYKANNANDNKKKKALQRAHSCGSILFKDGHRLSSMFEALTRHAQLTDSLSSLPNSLNNTLVKFGQASGALHHHHHNGNGGGHQGMFSIGDNPSDRTTNSTALEDTKFNLKLAARNSTVGAILQVPSRCCSLC